MMGNGQTACLAVAGQVVAEGRSRDHHKCRSLTEKRERTDKNDETQQRQHNKRTPNSLNFLQQQEGDF